MKKLFLLVLCLCLMAAPALAEVVVEDANVVWCGADNEFCYVLAKVTNTGAEGAYLDGSLRVTDAEGNIVAENDFLMVNPYHLGAGQSAYVKFYAWVEEGRGVDCTYALTQEKDYVESVTQLPMAAELVIDEYGDVDAWVTVTNTAQEPMDDPYLLVVFRDEQGKLMDVQQCEIYNTRLMPGDRFLRRMPMESELSEKYAKDQVKIASVEAILYLCE